MKKFSFFKIASLALVCVMLLGAFMFTTFANDESADETVEIVSQNVYFDDKLELMFAVNAPAGHSVTATVNGEEVDVVLYATNPTDDNDVKVADYAYKLVQGVVPQAIDTVVTFTVTYGETTVSKNYSVLQYLYERINVSNNRAEGEELVMFEALLAYADAANAYLDGATVSFNDYKYVTVVDGTLDGYNTTGMFAPDATPFGNIVANEYDAAAYHVEWDVSVDGAAAERHDDDAIKTLAVSGKSMTVTRVLVENAHTHTWDDGVATIPATCTTEGVLTKTCTYDGCGETTTEVIEALGHNIVTDAAVAPTCTETGLTEGSHCTRCNDATVEQTEVPATGHTEVVDAAVAATCTTTGLTEGKHCSVCKNVLVAQVVTPVDSTNHSVENGACQLCGMKEAWVAVGLEDIAATDVIIITWTKSDGNVYAITNTNGTGSAPAAVAVTVADGKLSSDITDNIKWNISNSNGDLTIYPNGTTATWLYCTSTNNGVRVGTNTNKTFTIDSESGYLKHTGTSRYLGIYSTQDVRCYTTSTTTNIANQTLAFYKLSFVSNEGGETPAPSCEHTNTTTTTVDATCTEAGSVTVTCDDCGETVSTETIDALGHTYVDGTCSACGATESEGGDEPETPVEKTESVVVYGSTGALNSDRISWTNGGITVLNIKGSTAIRTSDADHYRVYANSTLTISCTGKLKTVVITATSGSYATVLQTSLQNAGYTVTVDGSVVTVTVDSGVNEITCTASAQTRIKNVEVTYEG